MIPIANTCDNKLTLRGPRKDILAMLKWLAGPDEDWNSEAIMPMPKSIAKLGTGSTINKAWHKRRNWESDNWGGSYDMDPVKAYHVEKNGKSWVFTSGFGSNWTPPTGIMRHACKRFPTVTLTLVYQEPGMGFEGSFKAKGKRVVVEEERDLMSEDDSEVEDE